MKICFITNYLAPYRIEWMNMLGRGAEVSAFYEFADEKTRTAEWLKSKQPMFFAEQVGKSPVTKKTASRKFINELLNGGYDIFIIDGYSSPIKLQLIHKLLKAKKKVFINIDGVDIWKQKTSADIIKDKIKKRVFRSGAYFLCGSELAAKMITDCSVSGDRVFVHNFTTLYEKDMISFEQKKKMQSEAKKSLGCGGKKVVLAVGRFLKLKRYDVLIRAWKDMPDDCRLFLIGGGEEHMEYLQLTEELNVKNIEILDFVLPEKLIDYYLAADLFVHPSSTEVWGLVINEAMAKGCPVIATNHCVGAVELIRDGVEGYLTEVGNSEELHQKMLTVLSDGRLRDKMIKNAAERIRQYTYENLAKTHLEIFNNALK